MSKKALFLLPITFIVISTASCSWLFGGKKDITYSPDNVMNRRIKGDTHRITYKGFELSGDVAVGVIDRALETEYTYIKTVPEQSDNYFVLHVNLPSLMGYNRVNITFFENGYANTYKSSTSDSYYYAFDESLAKSLCDYVDDAYEEEQDKIRKEQEERDNIEREYNEMIENMTIFTLLDKMVEEENVSLEFYFVTDEEDPRFYDFTFKDDGSIYAALKGAQYSEFVMPETTPDNITPAYLNITGRGWKITIDKAAESVDAEFTTTDKYCRTYSRKFQLTIDKDSLATVMNRAYELSAPTNPFNNSSSNPSSSSEEHA